MESAFFNTILSVIIVSLISFVGVFTLSLGTKRLSKILLVLVGFATGALFGDVFIHLLPEIAEKGGFTLLTSFSLLGGLLFFFIIEKFVQWRHCHITTKGHSVAHPFATTNLIGDAFHNFIDGILIAGSYLASIPLGIATTIAVILHEIPQEIGDFGVLLHAGMKPKRALFFNFITALTAILGALFFFIFNGSETSLAFIIPFTAGGFIYIAGADLLPELHKAEYTFKTATMQFLSILFGMLIMYGLVFLE
jgi:zinc and cadmium transporter